MILAGAALGCDDSTLRPIAYLDEGDDSEASTGGSDTRGGSGGLRATGGRVATGGAGGTAGATGQEPETGGVPATGGASETGGSSGSGGVAGTGGALRSCRFTPNDLGTVFASENDCGVQGSWYSYDDCDPNDPNEPCATVRTPDAENEFPPDEAGRMCTSGSTLAVENEADQGVHWGAGIGLKLNEGLNGEPKGTLGDLDVTIIGFGFTVNGRAVPDTLKVTFPTEATIDRAHGVELSPEPSGAHRVMLVDAEQPTWVPPTERLDLEPTQVTAIQFQIQSQIDARIEFDFCIEGLTALYRPKP